MRSCRLRQFAGFTLLELMIVLVVLGIILGFAWPSMERLLRRAELESAGKEIRNALGEARLDAIESGEIRVFRYQPGTGYYECVPQTDVVPSAMDTTLDMGATGATGIDPLDFGGDTSLGLEDDMSLGLDPNAGLASISDFPTSDIAAMDSFGDPIADMGSVPMADIPAAVPQMQATTYLTLPGDVTFLQPAQADVRQAAEETASDVPDLMSSSVSTTQWAPPIVFYPNGRTSSRMIRLVTIPRGDRQYTIDVMLRGLTGSARVGDVETYYPETALLSGETSVNDPLSVPSLDPLGAGGTEPLFDSGMGMEGFGDESASGLTEGMFGGELP